MAIRLSAHGIDKSFTMHLRGGVKLPVIRDLSFQVSAGECVVLDGPSGAGKSSVLKMVYGSYSTDRGSIILTDRNRASVDIAAAAPRTVLSLRRRVVGHVTQFLRVVPRVSTRDVVAAPLITTGVDQAEAVCRAEAVLDRLNIPQRLWDLPPSTFSGGEQQRVNIARGFLTDHALLLLDEPSASLDAANRQVVIDLIARKKVAGVAMLAIFHDPAMREAVADRYVDVDRSMLSHPAA